MAMKDMSTMSFLIIERYSKNNKEYKCDFELLDMSGFTYAMILHDKCVDEDGVKEHEHYHLFLKGIKRHQMSYFFNLVCNCFKCVPDAVRVERPDSEQGCLQYLIHRNHPNKHPYPRELIKHNYNQDYLDDLLNTPMSKDTVLSVALLESYYDEVQGDKLAFIQKIGIQRYNTYRYVINDFINSYRPIYQKKLYADCSEE